MTSLNTFNKRIRLNICLMLPNQDATVWDSSSSKQSQPDSISISPLNWAEHEGIFTRFEEWWVLFSLFDAGHMIQNMNICYFLDSRKYLQILSPLLLYFQQWWNEDGDDSWEGGESGALRADRAQSECGQNSPPDEERQIVLSWSILSSDIRLSDGPFSCIIWLAL